MTGGAGTRTSSSGPPLARAAARLARRERASGRNEALRQKSAWTITSTYRWLLVPPLLFVLVFFVWPMTVVISRGFSDPEPGIQNYERIFAGGPYLQVLYITVETATIVTLLCLLIAYPIAYSMAKARGMLLQIMAAMVIIPLWTSVVIRSYAWMVIFQRHGVLNGALVTMGVIDAPYHFIPGTLAVNVGMVHIMLPFMILPLVVNMRSIDRSLLQAASVLGATPAASFLKIFLPLSLPGIAAGCALVFMMSLGFFITPALLGGPRHMMAAVLIEEQANALLNWGLASALATVLLVLTLAIYGVYLRLLGGAMVGLARAR